MLLSLQWSKQQPSFLIHFRDLLSVRSCFSRCSHQTIHYKKSTNLLKYAYNLLLLSYEIFMMEIKNRHCLLKNILIFIAFQLNFAFESLIFEAFQCIHWSYVFLVIFKMWQSKEIQIPWEIINSCFLSEFNLDLSSMNVIQIHTNL